MSAQAKEEIPTYFNPKEIGQSFKKMTVDTIKTTNQEVTSVWFHSDCDAELYLFKDKNTNIIKQQLFFSGQLVEWNVVEGVKTGVIFETEKVIGGHGFQEDMRLDKTPLTLALSQAQDIISFIDSNIILEKDEILLNYKGNPRISQMRPYDVLKKYHPEELKKKSWLMKLFLKFLRKK